MSIGFDRGRWENLHEADMESLLDEAMRPGMRVMKEALVLFEGIIKRTLSGARSGRTYRVSKTGRLHVASAPGEPPAVLFGALRNSIGHDGPNRKGRFAIEGEVGSGLGQPPRGGEVDASKAYARRMEFGGTDSRGIRIRPRPWLKPSEDKAIPRINALFDRRLGRR